MGRGHHIPYPVFWFEGRRWFGHRWAAKHIHGQDIDGFHTDHCCPHIPLPNTLCVEHVQSLTPKMNRLLQHTRRKHFIHLQVGLLQYEDLYQHSPGPVPAELQDIPFYSAPTWLGLTQGHTHDDCPF